MQRALKAHQEAELAEAARSLLLNRNDSRAVFRQSLNGHNINGSGPFGGHAGVFKDASGSTGMASGGSSSSGSARGTGTQTPLARSPDAQASTSQPIPLSFAATREHLDGVHNPPPGTLHLSPGLVTPNGGKHGSTSNYELGSSFVDSTLLASPFANGNYTEVLGGESDWISATIPIVTGLSC